MNPEIDITDVVLNTKRLILRPWRLSDIDDLYAYASVDGVGQMAGWSPHGNIEESRVILNLFIYEKKTLAIEYMGRVIGSIGIEKYDEREFPELKEKKCREIGYALSKDFWGMGLAPEAVKEVIRYLFEEVNLDAVLCSHFVTNNQSKRVQEKCGFRFYANGIYKTQFNTQEKDVINILTKEDWTGTVRDV